MLSLGSIFYDALSIPIVSRGDGMHAPCKTHISKLPAPCIFAGTGVWGFNILGEHPSYTFHEVRQSSHRRLVAWGVLLRKGSAGDHFLQGNLTIRNTFKPSRLFSKTRQIER